MANELNKNSVKNSVILKKKNEAEAQTPKLGTYLLTEAEGSVEF